VFLRRDHTFAEQPLRTVRVEFLLLHVRLRVEHRLLRRFDLLLAGTGESECEIRLAYSDARLISEHPLLVIIVVEPRQQCVSLNRLAFLYGQFDNSSLHLEADQTFVRFDVAREHEFVLRFHVLGKLRVQVHTGSNQRRQDNQEWYALFHNSSDPYQKKIERSRIKAPIQSSTIGTKGLIFKTSCDSSVAIAPAK
jgi:hypothetical protein